MAGHLIPTGEYPQHSKVTQSFRFSSSLGDFFWEASMAVIAGTESLEAPLDHPREQGEDRTNLIINYLPQVTHDFGLANDFTLLSAGND